MESRLKNRWIEIIDKISKLFDRRHYPSSNANQVKIDCIGFGYNPCVNLCIIMLYNPLHLSLIHTNVLDSGIY